MFYNTVFVLQSAACVVLIIAAVYVFCQRPSRMQTEMLVTVLSTMIMLLGYLMEMSSDNMQAAMLGVFVSYIGKPFVMVSSFLFIAEYCGYKIKKIHITLLCIFAASFIAAVGTTQTTHIYYSSIKENPNGVFSPLVLEHGPYYYVYMATIITYMIVCIVLTVREFIRNKNKIARKQTLLLMGIPVSGVAGYLVYLYSGTEGYDFTMAGCVVGTALLMVLFTKYHLFDVLTLAKDHALENSSVGLLVTDARGKCVYRNNFLTELLQDTFSEDELISLKDESTIIRKNDCVYDIQKRNIEEKGRSFGCMIEVSDITSSYNYSARLEKDVKQKASEIRHIQRSVIAGLADIVEERDGETGDHIKRTRDYVKIMATDMKNAGLYPEILTDEYIEMLYDVAPLHDIGKISISDAILLKPGKLTPEEFETMKTHSVHGSGIIHNIMTGIETEEYIEMASDVAGFHHEKWNGTGYPTGLSGTDIPLSARIMAVADVYEAVRAKRCYKEPMDKEEARKIIFDGKGTHFDPNVVDSFSNCIDKIEKII